MTPNGGEAMRQSKMTSEKVLNCYHEFQHLDGRTRSLSFGFRYENDMRSWMFEQKRVWRIAIFSLELFIIRRTPRHAEGFTPLFFWSYPIYKIIFIMELT